MLNFLSKRLFKRSSQSNSDDNIQVNPSELSNATNEITKNDSHASTTSGNGNSVPRDTIVVDGHMIDEWDDCDVSLQLNSSPEVIKTLLCDDEIQTGSNPLVDKPEAVQTNKLAAKHRMMLLRELALPIISQRNCQGTIHKHKSKRAMLRQPFRRAVRI
jgi:hypothetical protein